MTESKTLLMVLMPVYNEEECVRDAVNEVRQHILDRIPASRLTVVNDGSKDASGRILDELAAADPRITVLHKMNGGHGDSLMAGMNGSSARYFALLDGDRQIPLNHFARHWTLRGKHTFISGIRTKRQDATHRLLLTFSLRVGILLLFQRWLRDANVPYKIFPAHLWMQARKRIPPETLTPSLFLAIAARRSRRVKFVQVEVEHRERKTGKVTLVSWRLMRFCLKALRQLVQFRWRLGGGF